MKIVDEKGRLFGKINLIDLFVILAVLAVLCVGGYKLITTVQDSQAEAQAVAEAKRVRYTAVVEDIPLAVCESAKNQIGKSIINNYKPVDSKITDVYWEVNPEHDWKYDLYVTMEGHAALNEYVYKVGTQECRIGYRIFVKTTEFEQSAMIVAMEVFDD